MDMTDQSNYFMFFGNDVAADPFRAFQEVANKNYSLFPLDVYGMGLALQSGFEYLTWDSLFPPAQLKKIRETVEKVALNWFTSEKKSFTSSGICWPEFDYIAMYWSWYDAIISHHLARQLKKWNSRVLMAEVPSDPKPSVFAYT